MVVRDGARFKAGPGPDTAVNVWSGAVFNGARGNDRVSGYVHHGTVYGGPSWDVANGCTLDDTFIGVELVEWVFCD